MRPGVLLPGLTEGRAWEGPVGSRGQRHRPRPPGKHRDTALRLARYFGTTPELWVNLQARYDLELAKSAVGASIAMQVVPRAA